MRIIIFLIIFIGLNNTSFGQLPNNVMNKLGDEPLIFLDSVEIDIDKMKSLNPFDISNITVVTSKKAKKEIGKRAADGAIYITTINKAKEYYWNFFCSKSLEYKSLLNSPQADSIVGYILNGKELRDSVAAGSLFLVNRKNFKRLQVLNKQKEYAANFFTKPYIVVIETKKIKN